MSAQAYRGMYQILGAKIRRQREKKGLTQEALGRQVGLSRTSITNVEQGRQTLLLHQFIEIAHALDMQPSALMPAAKSKQGSQIPTEIAHLIKRLKTETN